MMMASRYSYALPCVDFIPPPVLFPINCCYDFVTDELIILIEAQSSSRMLTLH
jgi:hypothetical protein